MPKIPHPSSSLTPSSERTPKKALPKSRKSRVKSASAQSTMPLPDPTFGLALSAANKRLAKAIEQRAEYQGRLAAIEAEIPSLQSIIVALSGGMTAPPIPQAEFDRIDVYSQSGDTYTKVASQPVPAAIQSIGRRPTRGSVPSNFGAAAAGMIGGSLKGMGSVPASRVNAAPGPVEVELPEIEGQEIAGDLPDTGRSNLA